MKEDHAGETHWKEYRKSDKLNAIGNKNEEFRAGYWYAVETLGYDAHKVIADEHALRTEMEATSRNGCAVFGQQVVRWRRLASKSGGNDD